MGLFRFECFCHCCGFSSVATGADAPVDPCPTGCQAGQGVAENTTRLDVDGVLLLVGPDSEKVRVVEELWRAAGAEPMHAVATRRLDGGKGDNFVVRMWQERATEADVASGAWMPPAEFDGVPAGAKVLCVGLPREDLSKLYKFGVTPCLVKEGDAKAVISEVAALAEKFDLEDDRTFISSCCGYRVGYSEDCPGCGYACYG